MAVRHRTPTIFTLYMVDVLCCALGCVILLWQMNYHEAQDQKAATDDASSKLRQAQELIEGLTTRISTLNTDLSSSKSEQNRLASQIAALSQDLTATQKQKAQLSLELADMRSQKDKALQLALITKKDYDETRQALAVAQQVVQNLRGDLKKLEGQSTATAAELAAKLREQEELAKKLKGTELQVVVLQKDLADKMLRNQDAAKRVEELSGKLKESEGRAQKLEQTLADLRLLSQDHLAKLTTADRRTKLLEADIDKHKKDILDAAVRYRELIAAQELLAKRLKLSEKDIDEAKNTIASLQGEKLSLLLQAKALQDLADNRFAGIALTGQRVVFLIDMSGSMELADENTPDPDKWPLLCETVAKIMRSLPELKQYQVIMFSDKVRYPFGNEGRWLTFHSKVSPKAVADGLRAIKPTGATNMSAGFQEAFRFRAQGLDTMYVFSDGLPTMGEGLPADAANLAETKKTEILSKHLRSRLKNVWNAPAAGQPRVRINALGFFFESPDVGAFLWALSREHDGAFVGMR